MALAKIWTELEKDLLIKEYPKGNLSELEIKLKVKRLTISKMAKKLGIQRESRWSKEQLEILHNQYENGDIELLSKMLGKKIHAIHEYARKRGLFRKININRNGTLQPLLDNTNESYYWLGMYAADGYIAKNGHFMLSQSEKDKEQVYKLADFLNTDVYVIPTSKLSKGSYKNSTQSYRVNISDKAIGLKIRKMFGITDALSKTYSGISLSFMKDNDIQNLSFLVGLIDGDGYISKRGDVRIECHMSWLDTFNRLIHKLPIDFKQIKIKQTKHKKDGKIHYYVAMFIPKRMAILLHQHIIKHKLPASSRKWGQFRELPLHPQLQPDHLRLDSTG